MRTNGEEADRPPGSRTVRLEGYVPGTVGTNHGCAPAIVVAPIVQRYEAIRSLSHAPRADSCTPTFASTVRSRCGGTNGGGVSGAKSQGSVTQRASTPARLSVNRRFGADDGPANRNGLTTASEYVPSDPVRFVTRTPRDQSVEFE